MPKTILFTFENDLLRDKFLFQVRGLATGSIVPAYADNDLILKTLDTIRLDPPIKTDAERSAALFVSGKKLVEGSLSDMQKRFDQEMASHSASLEIRELREGEWKTIRSRKQQRL